MLALSATTLPAVTESTVMSLFKSYLTTPLAATEAVVFLPLVKSRPSLNIVVSVVPLAL